MKIISRTEPISQDVLIDKLDAFLEMRIKFEIDELKADILKTSNDNKRLVETVERLQKDRATAAALDSLSSAIFDSIAP